MVESGVVKIIDIEAQTARAVLARVKVHGQHSFTTWIPKSVIDEKRRIEDWFQEQLVERFAHEMAEN